MVNYEILSNQALLTVLTEKEDEHLTFPEKIDRLNELEKPVKLNKTKHTKPPF